MRMKIILLCSCFIFLVERRTWEFYLQEKMEWPFLLGGFHGSCRVETAEGLSVLVVCINYHARYDKNWLHLGDFRRRHRWVSGSCFCATWWVTGYDNGIEYTLRGQWLDFKHVCNHSLLQLMLKAGCGLYITLEETRSALWRIRRNSPRSDLGIV